MTHFTTTEAHALMNLIGAPRRGFSYADVAKGMNVELEHGSRRKLTNVTDDNPVLTLKIALVHLYERPDYYELLEELEKAPRRR